MAKCFLYIFDIVIYRHKKMPSVQTIISNAFKNKESLSKQDTIDAIEQTIYKLDNGIKRVAEKDINGEWIVNDYVKKAIILYFQIKKMKKMDCDPFEFYDKIPLKKNFEQKNIRVVPHAIARYGSFINENSILMPSYINIGAYVGCGSMIDTWATIGSCAQIGDNVHISGGVGIGGVLEPIQAKPVIIEDNCFIGSRCIVVEGVQVKAEAVLGAGVVLTQSTKIIDVSNSEAKYYKGVIPAGSVVIPGAFEKKFKAGTFSVPCALIIGKRKESTDKKTTLNNALREFNVSI